MRPIRCLITAVTAAFALSLTASAAVISPTSVTLVQGTEFFSAQNLIDGGGTAVGATWVTDAPNGAGDYYLPGSEGPIPIVVLDLGADSTFDTLLVWPYGVPGNSASDLVLRFATEADGPTGFGTSITYSPTRIAPPTSPGSLLLDQEVTCRYVEISMPDNYFEGYAGGDRVGLGEIAFETPPDPPEPPTLLTQPQQQTVFVGDTVNFSITADGSVPFSAQWRKDSVDIPGATGLNYTIANVLATDGGTYDVVVTNIAGSATSDSALLLVKEVPISPVSVVQIQAAEFFAATNLLDGGGTSAGATWVTDAPNGGAGDYFNILSNAPNPILIFDLGADTAIDSVLIWPYSNTGNSARNITLEFATDADGTNGFGTTVTFSPEVIAPDQPQADARTIGLGQTVTTRYVKMEITDNYFNISPPGGDRVGMSEVAFAPPLLGVAPLIVRDPQPQTTVFGSGAVIIDVDVFGSLPFSFQWRLDGVDVAGATNQILVLDNPGFGEQGDYDVVVSNSEGTATSGTAALTVTTDIVEPTAQGILEGATATFAIETDAELYQWSRDGVAVAGATNQVLAIENVIPADAGGYTVHMTIGTSTAETAVAGVLTTLSPAGRSDYELVVLSDSPRGYWRLGETSGTNAVDETGLHDGVYSNSPSLGVAGVIAGDPDPAVQFFAGSQTKVEVPYSPDLNPASYTFECWAQVSGGSTYRSPITSRAGSPQAGYIFYAEPNGAWDFWTGPGWHQMNGPTIATVGEWVHLAGTYDAETQTKTLIIDGQIDGVATEVSFNRNTQEILRIGGGSTEQVVGEWFFEGAIDEVAVYGEALSLERIRAHYLAGLFGGNSPPFIDGQPEDQFLVLGDTNTVITFNAVVSGSPPLGYQWSKGGVPIPGANTDTYVITNATPADVGTYSLTATNDLGSATSDAAQLALTTGPVAPAPQLRLEGDTTTFTVTMPEDSTGYLYQWQFGGVDIAGATDATLELTGLASGDAGTYTVDVTLGPDVATSDPAALAVTPLPTDTYANLVVAANPLVWWRLGDGPGSVVALDEYGFNDADITVDVTMGASGALLGDADTAAQFPGGNNSKIELFDPFDVATSQFSVEFWALSSGGSGFRSPITMRDRDGGTGQRWGWTFYATTANEWRFDSYDGTAGPWNSIVGPPVVQGAWTHVVGTYDGVDMKLYVDGALAGTVENAPYLDNGALTPLWIGAGATEDNALDAGAFFWVGKVDEVALYDRALTAGEVVEHWAAAFQAGTAPEVTGDPQFAWALPGGDASFSVAARGTPLVEYQWQKDGVDIPGATGATLDLTGVTEADAGFYSAVVSNAGGSATSAAAELYVPGDLTTTYQVLVMGDSPVAYWPLDETSGVLADDVMGANDGTIINGPALGQPGAIPDDAGTSYIFSQASTQKVEVPYSADLNPSNFTIEVWARVDGGTGHRSPLTSRDDFPQAGYIFYADPGNNWQFWTGSGEQVGWANMDWGQGALENGKWYHLVGTYDGTTKSFYVDGQLVGSGGAVVAPNPQRVLRIAAGATDADPGSFFFDGGVDEVAVYDYVLSEKQIISHFVAGLAAELIPMSIGMDGGLPSISWDGSAVLQQSEDLPGTVWTNVPGAPTSPYQETAPVGARSFRLIEP